MGENTEEVKVVKKQSHVYNVELMTVVAWGNTFTYKHYAPETLKEVPAEVREYALKGFIDDLQDCTVGVKKADYPKTPKGEDDYRQDCLVKRRELEGHINTGTRPPRANSTGKAEDKAALNTVKEAAKAVTMQGLIIKQVLASLPGNEPFTEADAEKLAEFLELAAKGGKKR
jgi:hypothetical protein